MAMALAIVLTAIAVAALTAWYVRGAVRRGINQAIGGRAGLDPIAEHHRMLASERHDAQAAVRRCDLLRLSLDAMTSGVIVTDASGRELIRNGLARAVSSRSHEQTLIDAAASELLATALSGRSDDREVEVFGPPPRVLFVHAVPIVAGESISGALAVIDDVSEHHRIEKTRTDFVANLSHELRTPVGAVSLLVEMLDGEPDGETRDQLTKRLLFETERMSSTVDDLLELSRIESDTESYDEAIRVQSLIDDAVARTRVAAEAAEVTVGSVSPAEPIVLLGNHDQMLSALVNLIDNAIKYSQPGDTVSVRSRIESESVVVLVQDTGRGIPARDLDRVFERFYRVDRSRDSSTGGTGIGLSIVRHVALNHGGSVSVESVDGEGSTFRLEFPHLGLESPADESGEIAR